MLYGPNSTSWKDGEKERQAAQDRARRAWAALGVVLVLATAGAFYGGLWAVL